MSVKPLLAISRWVQKLSKKASGCATCSCERAPPVSVSVGSTSPCYYA